MPLVRERGVQRDLDARDAALLRALLDATRIRGVTVLRDYYHDGADCSIGAERQRSDGRDLREAIALACTRMGLDPEPPPATPAPGGMGSTEEGGP